MTVFIRLLADKDKELSLLSSSYALRNNVNDDRIFQLNSQSFRKLPAVTFSYWVSEAVIAAFQSLPALQAPPQRTICSTNPLNADFRHVRLWWEITASRTAPNWRPWAKGGSFSAFYYDIHTVIHWNLKRGLYFGFIGTENRPLERPASSQYFFRPGLTWPRRTNGLSFRVMPKGCIFADKGPAAFVAHDIYLNILALCAILNSRPFFLLVSVQLARTELAQSFEVGLIQKTPVPELIPTQQAELAALAGRAWSEKRSLDTINETSHAFLLPASLRSCSSAFDPPSIEAELARIQVEIDAFAFNVYGFSEIDHASVQVSSPQTAHQDLEEAELDDGAVDDEDGATPIDGTDALLSWAVGVAFGRFDWRLATGERAAPPDPDPFDPLPAKSPGMLPDDAEPFHRHAGILVDDHGHPRDLRHLTEEVLARVNASVATDVRRWLRRDFFPFHLQRYSKSRRKAPIYWPLATVSGSYTLWLYYPSLTSQTLYSAVNDFVEPKAKKLEQEAAALRAKGDARSRDDDTRLEALLDLQNELLDLRDTLLRITPTYRPNPDDGVQITAAPLWTLFRNKPWQKLLKETWLKLQKGDYDWAHLAMAYWPARVREKCKTDKLLAIAHDLEHLYVEPEAKPAKTKGRRPGTRP